MAKHFLLLFSCICLTFVTSFADNGFEYVGCYTDNLGKRLFEEVTYMDSNLSVENCANYCKEKHYVYAGLEWARDCRCGNDLKDRASYPELPAGSCSMTCPGNPSQKCGQFSIMSVYKTGYGEPKALLDFVVKKIDFKVFI